MDEVNMDSVAQGIREAVPDLVAIYIFGSHLSGEQSDESDVDLALLATSALDEGNIWSISQSVASMIGRDVDLVDLRNASSVMRMQVIAHGHRLYCRDEQVCGEFEDFVYADFARLNEERALILADVRQRGTVYG